MLYNLEKNKVCSKVDCQECPSFDKKTKTCKGFVKRAAACIVAGAVAATLIPAAVSAEGEEIPVGTAVVIVGIDGVKLKCSRKQA